MEVYENDIQIILCYDYVVTVRHQKELTLTESVLVEIGTEKLSREPSVTLLTDMCVQLRVFTI